MYGLWLPVNLLLLDRVKLFVGLYITDGERARFRLVESQVE